MKRLLYVYIILALPLLIAGCGGGPGGGGGSENPPAVRQTRAVYEINADDPLASRAPFPNLVIQGMLAQQTATRADQSFPVLYLPISDDMPSDKKAFYELLNKAALEGLSPNMFITVPVSGVVDDNTVAGHYLLVDLTDAANGNGTINETSKLVYRQVISHDYSALRFYPVEPLDPGHLYAFVLLKGIKDLSGNLLEKPATNTYRLLESEQPVSDPVLEQARKVYSAAYSLLSNMNITRDNTVILVPFVTASKTLSAASFALLQSCSNSDNPVDCVDNNFNSTRDTLFYGNASQEMLGLVSASRITFGTWHEILTNSTLCENYLNGTEYEYVCGNETQAAIAFCSSFVNATGGYVSSFDVTKIPAVDLVGKLYNATGDADSLYRLVVSIMTNSTYRDVVPYEVNGTGYYNDTVLMYQHGLGGNKTIGGSVSGILNATVIAMDLPWHGDRTPSSGPCAKSGACFLTPNVPQDRINYYQAIVDQTVLMLATRAGCIDLDGNPDTVDVPSSFYYSGLSLGAITGSMFTALNYVDLSGKGLKVDRAVLNVGGANYAALVDEAERFPIQRLICEVMGGASLTDNCTDEVKVRTFVKQAKLTLGYALTMGILQTILDPSDPSWVVRGAISYYKAGDPQVILQSVYKDTFVPNVSNEALARAFGYSSSKTVLSIGGVETTPGWYMFGNDTSWAVHSFIFVDGLYQLCNISRTDDTATKQACLLNIYPELTPYADRINPDAIENIADAAWYQTFQFLFGTVGD